MSVDAPTNEAPTTKWLTSDHPSLLGHNDIDAQVKYAEQHHLATDHSISDDQSMTVGGDPLVGGHCPVEPHCQRAPDDPSAGSQTRLESQNRPAPGILSNQPSANAGTRPEDHPPDGWLELRIWAEMFHDAQQQRIASVNRAERGGVDPALYVAYIETVERAENTARLGMVRCYRRVVPPELRQWQVNSRGIGEHQMARLLGHLGDPYVATPHHWEGDGDKRVLLADEPFVRSVSQLWSYCGHGDPARRRTKGMTVDEAFALGKPLAKSLLFQIAESCLKAGGEYRLVYDQRRLDTEDRAHSAACVRCGPSGKPAVEGSPWSKAHQHADALRILGKEVLRDMWVARRNAEMAVAA